MLTPSTMSQMSDEHLVAAIRAELDPLTSTPIEIELLNRLEAQIDFLSVIDDAGFDSVEELEHELDLAKSFRALANDAGDVFTRLTTLINEQE